MRSSSGVSAKLWIIDSFLELSQEKKEKIACMEQAIS
jgi:hypothetical protein